MTPTPEQVAEWQEHVIALEAALASGVLEVWYKGRRETYRSTGDLLTAISYFKGLIANAVPDEAMIRNTVLIQSDS